MSSKTKGFNRCSNKPQNEVLEKNDISIGSCFGIKLGKFFKYAFPDSCFNEANIQKLP